MSRPRSPALIAALADIAANNITAYQSAKKHGVLQSTISRARKVRPKCPLCGGVIRK